MASWRTPPEKRKALLVQADLDVVSVRKAFASTAPIELDAVIAMYDERIDHPAWQDVKDASKSVREAIRTSFIESANADAVDGCVPNDVALCFTIGSKHSTQQSSAQRVYVLFRKYQTEAGGETTTTFPPSLLAQLGIFEAPMWSVPGLQGAPVRAERAPVLNDPNQFKDSLIEDEILGEPHFV